MSMHNHLMGKLKNNLPQLISKFDVVEIVEPQEQIVIKWYHMMLKKDILLYFQ
ncbi:hypothetical protein RDI58_025403 [Solanum bulbocastanum]|uniref:Uncharacterized protein n=1 Tax=Solanum bulbocastanum TaxID=147425 RepID=A0AAN8SZE2_SOLBU